MMKKFFHIKKWSVRALMAMGAFLGLTSCGGGIFPAPNVYGPPPDINKDPQVVEDVYGPPVEDIDSITSNEAAKDSVIKKTNKH